MKTFYLTYGSNNIIIDPETNSADRLECARTGINNVYLVKEPMHVVYGYKDEQKEFDVDADDIIVTFYSEDFTTHAIVVKNEEWVNNIKAYNKARQEEKERWAETKGTTPTCDEGESICKG